MNYQVQCENCKQFFKKFKCNKPLECDCPKCQGYCKCKEIDELFKNNKE